MALRGSFPPEPSRAHSSLPAGLGVCSFNPETALVSESGIPPALHTTHARVYVDLSGNHNTGLALANPNTAAQASQRTFLASPGTLRNHFSHSPEINNPL